MPGGLVVICRTKTDVILMSLITCGLGAGIRQLGRKVVQHSGLLLSPVRTNKKGVVAKCKFPQHLTNLEQPVSPAPTSFNPDRGNLLNLFPYEYI